MMKDIDIDEIEKQLDEEFISFKEEFDKKMNMFNKALYRNELEDLSDTDQVELKGLYRKIVKRLHPDMNPDLSQEELKMFLNAVYAYKNGDLKALRLIWRVIEDDEEYDAYDSLDGLKQLKMQLEDSIDETAIRIDEIKSHYPYLYKDILEDKNKVRELRNEYEKQLKDYDTASISLQSRIDNLLSRRYC